MTTTASVKVYNKATFASHPQFYFKYDDGGTYDTVAHVSYTKGSLVSMEIEYEQLYDVKKRSDLQYISYWNAFDFLDSIAHTSHSYIDTHGLETSTQTGYPYSMEFVTSGMLNGVNHLRLQQQSFIDACDVGSNFLYQFALLVPTSTIDRGTISYNFRVAYGNTFDNRVFQDHWTYAKNRKTLGEIADRMTTLIQAGYASGGVVNTDKWAKVDGDAMACWNRVYTGTTTSAPNIWYLVIP